MSTTAADDTGVLDLADRMFRAIEAGDLDTLRGVYADDFVAWSNFDDDTKDVEATLSVLGYEHERRVILEWNAGR